MKDHTSAEQYWVLWWWLIHAKDAINMVRQKELDRYNISARKSAVLFAIHFLGDKATPTAISDLLLRKPNTISEFLTRMEKAGLVRKVIHSNKWNLARVELTEKGRQVYELTTERESISRIFSILPQEKLEQLRSYLQVLRDKALQELDKRYESPYPPLNDS